MLNGKLVRLATGEWVGMGNVLSMWRRFQWWQCILIVLPVIGWGIGELAEIPAADVQEARQVAQAGVGLGRGQGAIKAHVPPLVAHGHASSGRSIAVLLEKVCQAGIDAGKLLGGQTDWQRRRRRQIRRLHRLGTTWARRQRPRIRPCIGHMYIGRLFSPAYECLSVVGKLLWRQIAPLSASAMSPIRKFQLPGC